MTSARSSRTPVLALVVALGVYLGECGGEAHALEASVDIVVEP